MIQKNQKSFLANFSKTVKNYNENALIQDYCAKKLVEISKQYLNQNHLGLDLGSGTGFIKKYLPKHLIIELDISLSMLQFCDSSTKINADFSEIPIKNDSLDFIISSFSMQWCNDFDKLFKEINRILKNEGILIFSLPIFESFPEIIEANISSNCNFNFLEMPKNYEILQNLEQNNFQKILNEQEIISKKHKNALNFIKEIKKIGASFAEIKNLNQKNFINRKKIEKFNDFLFEKYNNKVSWNVGYFIFKKYLC